MTVPLSHILLAVALTVANAGCKWGPVTHGFTNGWSLHSCSDPKSISAAGINIGGCVMAQAEHCKELVEWIADTQEQLGIIGVAGANHLTSQMLAGQTVTIADFTVKAALLQAKDCRHCTCKHSWCPCWDLDPEYRVCVAANKLPPRPPPPTTLPPTTLPPTTLPPSKKPEFFLTKYAIEIAPWNGCALGMNWFATGGSRLAMVGGTFSFFPGQGNGHLVQLTPTWSMRTGKADHGACFDSRGVSLRRNREPDEKDEPPPAWLSGNYGKEKAEMIVLFDKHWSIFVRREVYWLKSSLNYPDPEAPTATRILPWEGCAVGMTWFSPGGARLAMDKLGTSFYPGQGNGHLLQLTPTWRVVTGKAGAGACFDSSGNVILRQGDKDLWISHTYAGGVAPKKAVKIYLFDHAWALFDEDGKAIRTYPWDYYNPY